MSNTEKDVRAVIQVHKNQPEDLIQVVHKQSRMIRVLVGINAALLTVFLIGAQDRIERRLGPVDEIVFAGNNNAHWRISTIENAICFDIKTKSRPSEDDREWHRVAQLYADELHDRYGVRFDVGDFSDQRKEGDRMYGVASMGVMTNRMISSPFVAAIQGEKAENFPYNRDEINVASLGFGGPPFARAALGGLSFSPSLRLYEYKEGNAKWSARLENPNLKIERDGVVEEFPVQNE